MPYGKRTGVPAVDRLTIESHDRFQEIVDAANWPESIIGTGIIIGRDIPVEKSKLEVSAPAVVERLIGPSAPEAQVTQQPLFTEPEEQRVAQTTAIDV